MKRFWKRVAFGLLYLGILGFVSLAVYYFFFRPEPSCFDNKQNEKETGIDCGGPCIPCGLVGVALEQAPVQVIPVGERQMTLVAQVKNPSPDYAAFFSYNFEVSSKVGGELARREGKAFIEPSQNKYIVVPALSIDPDDLGRVNFTISRPSWNLSPIIPSYRLRLEGLVIAIESGRLKVTGRLVNEAASASPELGLVVLIFNDKDEIIAASSSLASGISAFSEKPFTVFVPSPKKTPPLTELKTKVFWEESF